MIVVRIVSINVYSLRLMDCIECQVNYNLIDLINRLRLVACVECQVSYSSIDIINRQDFNLVH